MDRLKELLKKLLGDQYTDEVEQQVDEAVQEHVEDRVEEETEGLKRKRDQLLKQNKKLKEGSDNAGELDELQERIDTLEGENQKLKRDYKRLETTASKKEKELSEQLSSEQSAVSQMVVDRGLDQELRKAGVPDGLINGAKALLRGGVQVVSEGDERKAMAGEKDLPSFVSEWAQSDEGKNYIKAAPNSGGGAGTAGSGTGGSAKSWKEMNLKERTELAKADPDRARELMNNKE